MEAIRSSIALALLCVVVACAEVSEPRLSLEEYIDSCVRLVEQTPETAANWGILQAALITSMQWYDETVPPQVLEDYHHSARMMLRELLRIAKDEEASDELDYPALIDASDWDFIMASAALAKAIDDMPVDTLRALSESGCFDFPPSPSQVPE